MNEKENTWVVPSENTKNAKNDREKHRLLLAFLLPTALILILIFYFTIRSIIRQEAQKSLEYQNYTLQKEQYYAAYTEQYDYLEFITVEYPRLEGMEENLQEQINTLMYDAAMDRVNYWHLMPDNEVLDFQKENFLIFCSDVDCDVLYHGKRLVSAHYCEFYAPNPVSLTQYTERGLNIDLQTGEVYGLADILTIDEDFLTLWCRSINEEQGEIFNLEDEDTVEILLSWFRGEDEELSGLYDFRPYFYLTESGDFAIGISLDPTPDMLLSLSHSFPQNSSFCTSIAPGNLEPYRTDSAFWDIYAKSEMAGQVLPCEDKQENLWLGKEASTWEYWEERGYY